MSQYHEIKKVLTDRRWHPLSDIINKVGPTITPEKACWYFKRKRKKPDLPYEVRVAKGRYIIIYEAVMGMKQRGLVETNGKGLEKRIKLLEWFCWACGEKQRGHLTKSRLCKPCKKLSESSSRK